jgi:hypothetical protein
VNACSRSQTSTKFCHEFGLMRQHGGPKVMRNLFYGVDAPCRINASLEGVDLTKKLLSASTVLHTFLKLRIRLSCNC